ncbi:DUF4199 domain-containing protein [Lutibacter sp. TH_r2]|uniref:DUF4199 domain-containing protein n=1 Tax=Lutibacter sp. TH_r2 TaxID=3082083 RepID=UPI00295352FF|nr:DUF4199 domain-containing protein [Lutibacter sp. TH_r2]MDV7187327.1 DUF4199 domain-containing protein [Lutibacter sp. TH_r2]
MENQKSSATSVMLNYGLILGFISILMAVVNYAIGDIYKPHWGIAVLSFVLTTALIVLGLKKVKENNGGYLNLGEALKTGLGIALISSIIYVIYLFIFTSYIEPEFYLNMAKVQEATILEQYPNMSDEQLETSKEMASKFIGPGVTTAFTLAGSLFFGFIISLIAGLIMKKSEEE